MPKVVFSSTLREPLAWPNTRLVDSDAVEAVRAMKRDGIRSMRTLGSLTLARSLLAAGLVDRFRLVVFPVVTGATGRERVYDGYPDVALELTESRTFDGRLAAARLRPDGARRAAGSRLTRRALQRRTGKRRWVTRSPWMQLLGSPSSTSVTATPAK